MLTFITSVNAKCIQNWNDVNKVKSSDNRVINPFDLEVKDVGGINDTCSCY